MLHWKRYAVFPVPTLPDLLQQACFSVQQQLSMRKGRLSLAYGMYRGQELPKWSQNTLLSHAGDPRRIKQLSELEAGDTGDLLWDAMQHQLLTTGLFLLPPPPPGPVFTAFALVHFLFAVLDVLPATCQREVFLDS